MSNDTQIQNLVITHIFDASVDQLWQAWTDPELIKQWWGPDGFTCPLANIDFREGGTSLLCMSSPDFGEHYSTWDYTAIVPMERIEFIHNLADKNGNKVNPVDVGMPEDFPIDQLHVITFKSLGDSQSEITVTEHDWSVGQMMEMSRLGMEQCLDKMAGILK